MSRRTVASNRASSRSTSSESWSEDTWASFLLWDIDREFQNAREAYERWTTKHKRRRSTWECIAGSNKENPLGGSLHLGSQVQKVIRDGQRKYGQRFEKGDATCHAILSAQLLRLQREVCMPLLDAAPSRYSFPIPHHELLRAAKGIRRVCLDALQDQTTRLSSRSIQPYLPPPRFSVAFCPLALQLQKDQRTSLSSTLPTQKVHRRDPYDDRETCPYCKTIISVAAHSGLPQYRRILFESHAPSQRQRHDERAQFACTGCYKTFDDPYAFLEHVFQKETGDERSCLKRYSTGFSVDARFLESDPRLVEQCLKNCLEREMTRSERIGKDIEMLRI